MQFSFQNIQPVTPEIETFVLNFIKENSIDDLIDNQWDDFRMLSFFSGFSIEASDIIFEVLLEEGCHDSSGFYRADVFLLNNKISEKRFIDYAKNAGEYGETAYCLCTGKNQNKEVIKNTLDFMFSDLGEAERTRSVFISEVDKSTPEHILLALHDRNWKSFSSIYSEPEYTYEEANRIINQLLYKNKY
jgi:hypothetical protein